MEEYLAESGLNPIISSSPGRMGTSFEQLARWHLLYQEISHHPAWKDFNHRIKQLRDATVQNLLVGWLDKTGKGRDNELRAVLHILDTLLLYVPATEREYERRQKEVERRAERAQNRSW